MKKKIKKNNTIKIAIIAIIILLFYYFNTQKKILKIINKKTIIPINKNIQAESLKLLDQIFSEKIKKENIIEEILNKKFIKEICKFYKLNKKDKRYSKFRKNYKILQNFGHLNSRIISISSNYTEKNIDSVKNLFGNIFNNDAKLYFLTKNNKILKIIKVLIISAIHSQGYHSILSFSKFIDSHILLYYMLNSSKNIDKFELVKNYLNLKNKIYNIHLKLIPFEIKNPNDGKYIYQKIVELDKLNLTSSEILKLSSLDILRKIKIIRKRSFIFYLLYKKYENFLLTLNKNIIENENNFKLKCNSFKNDHFNIYKDIYGIYEIYKTQKKYHYSLKLLSLILWYRSVYKKYPSNVDEIKQKFNIKFKKNKYINYINKNNNIIIKDNIGNIIFKPKT